MLTENEQRLLNHFVRWGSDGYMVCIAKRGRQWWWQDAFGVKGCPKPFKSKREAVQAIENYETILIDKKAGRL